MGSVKASRAVAATSALALAGIIADGALRLAEGKSDDLLVWTLLGTAVGAICGCILLAVRRRREPRVTSRAILLAGLFASVGGQLVFRALSGRGNTLGSAMGFLLVFIALSAYGSANRIRQRLNREP